MSTQPDEPNKVLADRIHEVITPTKCNKTAAEEHVFCHESGELFAEDVDQHMTILPEVVTPAKEITIEDIQVGDPGVPLTKKQTELRDRIWKSRHLLMGKGDALPPAARGGGAICDIDVGVGIYTNFDSGMVSTILRSQWQIRKVGGAVIKLDLRDQKMREGENEILGTLAASITPREEVDES